MVRVFLWIVLGCTFQSINATRFPKRQGTWTYEGSLIDPMTGQTIAKVVGLEHFHAVPDPKASEECFRSRKVFCYTDDQNQPLEFYRQRVNGPKRRIPTAVVESDSLVRYFGRYISTQFDTGKTVLGKIEPSDEANTSLKVFTTPTPRGTSSSTPPDEDLQRHLKDRDASSINNAPIRRHSWIQFGSVGSARSQRGVRETYDYRHDKVLYTRFGEGPVWYGPGRTAQLELTGQHYQEPYHVPIPNALADHIPKDFWEIPDTKTLLSTFSKRIKTTERSWWTKLRAATQFTVGERRTTEH